jgi:polar amino acid transport system substrate-binding protein
MRRVVDRFTAMLVALASIGALLAACSGTSTRIPVNADSGLPPARIRVGVEALFPPFENVDARNQELTGFDVELMQAIAARAGLDVQLVNVGKDRLLTGVLNCDYDAGISAISITDELRQQLVFSDSYLTVGQVIVVKKGNIVIADRDHLTGMVVGTQKGSPGAIALQNLPGVESVVYPTFDVAFQELIRGNIDAVIASEPRALNYAGIPANNLKIVGDRVDSESLGIAICNQNPDLTKRINDGLAVVKADGTLDKLVKRWLKSLSSLSG